MNRDHDPADRSPPRTAHPRCQPRQPVQEQSTQKRTPISCFALLGPGNGPSVCPSGAGSGLACRSAREPDEPEPGSAAPPVARRVVRACLPSFLPSLRACLARCLAPHAPSQLTSAFHGAWSCAEHVMQPHPPPSPPVAPPRCAARRAHEVSATGINPRIGHRPSTPLPLPHPNAFLASQQLFLLFLSPQHSFRSNQPTHNAYLPR